MLSTLKIKPTKCWKIFPLRNGRVEEGVGAKKETTVGCFVWQRWERKLSLSQFITLCPHQEVDSTVHLKGRVFTNDHKD